MANLNINGILKASDVTGDDLFDVNLIIENGKNYVRRSDGIQICFGEVPNSTGTVTLPKSFIDTNYKVFFAGTSNNSTGVTLYFISAFGKTTTTFNTLSASYARDYFAIGKWMED